METTQNHLSVSRKTFLGIAVTALVIVATVLAVSLQQRPPPYEGTIPLPFGENGSDLRGSILYYGKRNNIDVYEVSFLQNERVERMQTDIIYLVHVPTGVDIVTTSLDDVISTHNPAGIKNVDYYGYKYSDAVATAERAAVQQLLFKQRFPAKFFASKKARDNDSAHQNALAAFESLNDVIFLKTDGSAGAIRLEPGSLYAFVVNEANGANIAIRTPMCQNGVLESTEVCDDGNANNADCCKNDCSGAMPIPFGTCSSASSSAASSTASSISSSQASSQAASSVASSQASSQAASSIASSQASSQAVSSIASSKAAVVYPLTIAVQAMPATATTTTGQRGLSLFKFHATAGTAPVLLKGVMFIKQAGSLDNATEYKLYRQGIAEHVASATLSGSMMKFFRADGLGAVIAAGASVDFEVRATAALTPAVDPTLQLALFTAPANFITASVGGKMLGHIRTDGYCFFGCDIDVTTVPATVWTLQSALEGCGTNTPDAGCEAGPSADQSCTAAYGQTCTYCSQTCKIVSVNGPFCGDHLQQRAGADGTEGTADDEKCDDGDTDDTDACSNDCKLVSAPF